MYNCVYGVVYGWAIIWVRLLIGLEQFDNAKITGCSTVFGLWVSIVIQNSIKLSKVESAPFTYLHLHAKTSTLIKAIINKSLIASLLRTLQLEFVLTIIYRSVVDDAYSSQRYWRNKFDLWIFFVILKTLTPNSSRSDITQSVFVFLET